MNQIEVNSLLQMSVDGCKCETDCRCEEIASLKENAAHPGTPNAEAGVTRIVMPDPNTHEGIVLRERWGVSVYVPRWWAGKRVRVTLLEGRVEDRSNNGVTGAGGVP